MSNEFAAWTYIDSAGTHQEAFGLVLGQVADLVNTLSVQIFRNGVLSDDVLSIDRNSVRLTDRASVPLNETYRMATPNARQMSLINTFLPSGAELLLAEDLISIPFIAADNLINRSSDRWDIKSLRTMAKLLPGLPSLLDHEWEVEEEWGRIYDAKFVHSETAPDELINRAGNGTLNRQIVAEEGLAQVVFEVFARSDSSVVRALSGGHSGNISTGAFRFTDYECPLCQTSFSDDSCPHTLPDRWCDRPSDAPFAIRTGLFDLGEASIVAIPNLPGAKII